MLRKAALVATVLGAATTSVAQEQQDAAAIRAGHNLATSTCFACHVVSPNQAVAPVLGSGIPDFADIANRPGVTVESLAESMKIGRWHDAALAPRLLPMSRLSDQERTQVALYILSLRKSAD